MADSEENTQEAPLTEAQRIEKLEKNVGTSKLVLLLVALLLIIIISISVTAFAIFVGKGSAKDDVEFSAQIETLKTEVTSLAAKIDERDVVILTLEEKLKGLQSQQKSSGNSALISMLLDQEKDNQEVLNIARSSIYDLAHMVPGSRTWLDTYAEELDQAMGHSKSRQAKLSTMLNGEPAAVVEEDDDGFGDF